MNWSTQDNKAQRGKIDRIYVSATEYYELEHFVHHYLETEKYLVNDKNIKIVRAAIEEYPGSAPVKRADLTNYLNNHFNKP